MLKSLSFIFKNSLAGTQNSTLVILFLITAFLVFTNTFLQIHKRLAVNPYIYVHDGAMQTEEAIKFLIKGKNPYAENYFGTPLENRGIMRETNNINPAIYHFAYLPFNILFSIPFFIVSTFLMGWFDERFVYLAIFLLFIALALKWPEKSLKNKLVFLILFSVNPFFFVFFNEGRNDIFVFFWIALAVYFLSLKKNNRSSLALALAAASKQTSWILLPFYFAYLYYQEPEKFLLWQKITNIFKKTYVFFITTAIIIIPFLIWNLASFIDDTIKYSNGTAYMSYPITGFGFSQLILRSHIVSSPDDYWPFWIPQLVFGLPLLYVLLKAQKKNNTLSQMIFNFSLLLMTFWIFSRFFNDNYVGFLIMTFLFAAFLGKMPGKIFLPERQKN